MQQSVGQDGAGGGGPTCPNRGVCQVQQGGGHPRYLGGVCPVLIDHLSRYSGLPLCCTGGTHVVLEGRCVERMTHCPPNMQHAIYSTRSRATTVPTCTINELF